MQRSGWRKRQIADAEHAAQLNRVLLSLAGSQETVDLWWQSRNIAFDMMTPAAALLCDRERVEAYIFNKSDGGEY